MTWQEMDILLLGSFVYENTMRVIVCFYVSAALWIAYVMIGMAVNDCRVSHQNRRRLLAAISTCRMCGCALNRGEVAESDKFLLTHHCQQVGGHRELTCQSWCMQSAIDFGDARGSHPSFISAHSGYCGSCRGLYVVPSLPWPLWRISGSKYYLPALCLLCVPWICKFDRYNVLAHKQLLADCVKTWNTVLFGALPRHMQIKELQHLVAEYIVLGLGLSARRSRGKHLFHCPDFDNDDSYPCT